MHVSRFIVVLLLSLAVLIPAGAFRLATATVNASTDVRAVPLSPVAYDGSRVQIGLQRPNGNWVTQTIEQRLPCLGKITATVPVYSMVEVHLSGAEPEWQEVSAEFVDLGQSYTARILVVPQDGVINELQLNVPSTGRVVQVESEFAQPLAVVEMVGSTPVEIQVPPVTRQILSIIMGLLHIGGNTNLDDALNQEIPNMYVRWVDVTSEGWAEFVSPDGGFAQQPPAGESIRVRIMGVGWHKPVR